MDYEFKCTGYDGSVITMQFKAESLEDFLEHVTYFMRGCSWQIDTLEHVREEESNDKND